MSAPLDGIRILDLTRLLPGPYCTMLLADMGADVIKIEEPGQGDYTRSLNPGMFQMLNRNKRGVCLDLRQADDREALLRLVDEADVLVEGFRPGVMDRLGAGHEALRKRNPRLVYAAITGYGLDGPYRDRPGHDLNYCGYTGLIQQTGEPEQPPTPIAFQIADLAGGAQSAAIGILAAVIRAQRSGEGALVDISMTDCTLALQAAMLGSMNARGGASPPRGEDMLTGGLPNYRVYECADGKYLAIGALEFKFFKALCLALERPDLLKLPLAPGAGSAALRSELVSIFKSRSRDEWAALLADRDCCVSPILDPAEALADPHNQARGVIAQVDGQTQFLCPIRISGHDYRIERPAPELGQHNAEILAR